LSKGDAALSRLRCVPCGKIALAVYTSIWDCFARVAARNDKRLH
jgi:hypothetical protein